MIYSHKPPTFPPKLTPYPPTLMNFPATAVTAPPIPLNISNNVRNVAFVNFNGSK